MLSQRNGGDGGVNESAKEAGEGDKLLVRLARHSLLQHKSVPLFSLIVFLAGAKEAGTERDCREGEKLEKSFAETA